MDSRGIRFLILSQNELGVKEMRHRDSKGGRNFVALDRVVVGILIIVVYMLLIFQVYEAAAHRRPPERIAFAFLAHGAPFIASLLAQWTVFRGSSPFWRYAYLAVIGLGHFLVLATTAHGVFERLWPIVSGVEMAIYLLLLALLNRLLARKS